MSLILPDEMFYEILSFFSFKELIGIRLISKYFNTLFYGNFEYNKEVVSKKLLTERLTRGAGPNHYPQSSGGYQPFHYACYFGDLKLVKLLYKVIEETERENEEGSLYSGYRKMVNIGVYERSVGRGTSALHLAVVRNQYDVVEYLLSLEGNGLNCKSGIIDGGRSPFHDAMAYPEIAKLMIKKKVAPHGCFVYENRMLKVSGISDCFPIHDAIMKNFPFDSIEALLKSEKGEEEAVRTVEAYNVGYHFEPAHLAILFFEKKDVVKLLTLLKKKKANLKEKVKIGKYTGDSTCPTKNKKFVITAKDDVITLAKKMKFEKTIISEIKKIVQSKDE